MRHGVGDVGTAHLDVPTQQRCGNFTTALKGDITQVTRVDAGGLGDQCSLHPVLAADGTAGADDYFARVFLQRGNQVVEGLVGRVVFHCDGTIAGANGCQPAHGVLVEAAELALGQVEQRAAGPGYQGPGIRRALGNHGVVGNRADAARHIGHAHGFGKDLLVDQGALHQLAGQVEAAAGGGGGDAFRTFGFASHGLAGKHQTGSGEGNAAQ
ncbi:hypothetical protein D3C77_546110 [compost metagenome]